MKTFRGIALVLFVACMAGGLLSLRERARVAGDPASSAVQAEGTPRKPGDAGPASVGPAPAQSPEGKEPRAIASFVERPGFAERLEKALPAGAHHVRYARMDQAFLNGKSSPLWKPSGEGVFTLPLPDGRDVRVRVKSSEMLDAVRYISEGSIEGQPGSRVILAGGAQGQYSVEIMETTPVSRDGVTVACPRHVIMAPTGEAETMVFEVDELKAPPCGGQVVPSPAARQEALLRQRRAAVTAKAGLAGGMTAMGASGVDTGSVSSPLLAAATVTVPQVDVLFLYTQAVLDNQFGGTTDTKLAAVQARVDSIVASTNSDMARSGVDMKIRAVALEYVAYDETQASGSKVNSTALEQLGSETDGVLDGVHARREALGADLVCLILNRYDSSCIGIAYMLTTPTVKSTVDSVVNDYFAFSVVTYSYTSGYNLVSHELGHNFGAQHDRDNAYSTGTDGVRTNNPGAFSYSYGYRFTGQDGVQYRTIMAYAPGARLSYFSNPNIVASEPGINKAVGVAEGLAGESYNAKTLNETGFEVSQWRHQTTDPSARGTMVNVSTRAFVGTDSQQLTAGFSIEGAGTKELLIRASGPSLAAFGVADTVSDPWIELTAVPSMVVTATVDNWKKETNVAAIIEATTQISAFAQTSDKDAAMLIKLPAGMYTAKVEGVGGATGIGIVEVYETANPGTAKLVNLSTRAYATKKKELVGGFVISGEAGTTKRVLLRAQGPNLSNYGVTGAMNDPYMELYRVGSAPKLLVASDDWTVSVGQTDDEHPTATFYDEKAIAATGFAPKNRREPAILVDLEPGMYTLVVTPFERLSAVSSDNQPEQPGVAIVEVFEINP